MLTGDHALRITKLTLQGWTFQSDPYIVYRIKVVVNFSDIIDTVLHNRWPKSHIGYVLAYANIGYCLCSGPMVQHLSIALQSSRHHSLVKNELSTRPG